MKTILFTLCLTAALHAQTWVKVAAESTSNVVTIPAGTTYRFGDTTNKQ